MTKQLIWLAFVFVAFAVFLTSEIWRPVPTECDELGDFVASARAHQREAARNGLPIANLTVPREDMINCGIPLVLD